MIVAIIVAMTPEGLIGQGGRLPWHLPRDLARFRERTWGKPVLMGRRTFESIGRPLPGRTNIVLTRRNGYEAPGCRVVASLDAGLSLAAEILPGDPQAEAMVIGGAEVFRQAMPICDRIYLTRVEGSFEGDTFFPTEDLALGEWRPTFRERCEPDDRNAHAHTFTIYERSVRLPRPASRIASR